MIKRIKNLANTEEKKRLFSNFFSLSLLQAANYIFPLITLPYLVRVLGVEYFGLLAFATALTAYFSIITDYGFNLTATREISIHRDDREKVIEIFSSVMTIKMILMFVSFFLITILVFSFEKFSKDWEIYFLTFATILGQVLFPVWFFQGMERMKYITYLNVLSRLIFTVAIFIFVQEQNDYYMVPLLTSLGSLMAGAWSLVLVKREFGIKFELQSLDILKYYLLDGWYVFSGGMFTLIYTVSIPFVLGIFSNNTAVGYFTIVERIVKAITNLYMPISETLYPFMMKQISINQNKSKKLLLKLLGVSSSVMIFISCFIFFFAEFITILIAGKRVEQIEILFKIMALYPFIITIARIFAINYLVGFGFQSVLQKIYFYAFLVTLALIFFLIPNYEANGAVFLMMIIEIFATTYMFKEIVNKIGFK